jgi:hypothetical protein
MHNTMVIGTYLATVGGLRGRVIAAIQNGMKEEYLTVLDRSDIEDTSVAYSTHRIWWQEGDKDYPTGWIAESGHYDMSREAALANMLERALGA